MGSGCLNFLLDTGTVQLRSTTRCCLVNSLTGISMFMSCIMGHASFGSAVNASSSSAATSSANSPGLCHVLLSRKRLYVMTLVARNPFMCRLMVLFKASLKSGCCLPLLLPVPLLLMLLLLLLPWEEDIGLSLGKGLYSLGYLSSFVAIVTNWWNI